MNHPVLSPVRIKLFALLSVLMLLLLGLSCKKEYKAKSLPPNIQNYIYAYTAGTIAKTDAIKVRFTRKVVMKEEIGQPVKKGVFSLQPSVDGVAIWENEQALSFRPTENFKAGQSYLASVQLGQLIENLPEALRSFEFNFKIKQQSFYIDIAGVQTQNGDDHKLQMVEGLLKTSDTMDGEDAEKLLKVFFNDAKKKVEWTHSGNGRNHHFAIKDLERKDKDGILEINWNGSPLSIDVKGSEKITIPSIKDFKVLDAKVVQNPSRHIAVFFSDPVLKDQNLKGLVTLKNYKGTLRFEHDGNKLLIYPDGNINGSQQLTVHPGIKNVFKKKLEKSSEWEMLFESLKPQIRLVGDGVILPGTDEKYFPFEAVSLNAVEVEVFKIFNNNILQFLQNADITSQYNLRNVGRIILQKKVDLQTLNPDASSSGWARYALDLKDLIEDDSEAIYSIRLGFRKSYINYECSGDDEFEEQELSETDRMDENGYYKSFWDDYYGIYGRFNDYSWNKREEPCAKEYYYKDHFVCRNVFASNLGLIAKRGNDKSLFVAVSHLLNTNPLNGVALELYDFEQQLIATGETDVAGQALIRDLPRTPHLLIAKYGAEQGYLKLNDGGALPLSKFDVAGTKVQKGLKGFIYGERGVWRPGDSLFLNFVLEDKTKRLPQDHPIQFELYDARGQLQIKKTTSGNVNNVYPIPCATSPDAPTGNWRAVVKLGGATFSKTLKVETVKPNRLKMDIDVGGDELVLQNKYIKGSLQANWLHGAAAKNLKAKIEMEIAGTTTEFDDVKGYVFDDPTRKVKAQSQTIFEGKVDEDGHAAISWKLGMKETAPGKMKANFKTRVFEQSGDFSTDNFSIPFSPFDTYAGVALPEDKYGYKRLPRGKNVKLDFVNVDADGNRLSGKNLTVGLYEVNWRWWWQESDEQISRFNTGTHYGAAQKGTITTGRNGVASWDVKVENWGRYMIRVCDEKSGHCAGDFFYTGYPRGNQNKDAAAMLVFNADKKVYNAGEKINLTIPASEHSRCLISIENGDKVLETHWVNAQAGDNRFSFYTTEAMVPTVYAHVTLIQDHAKAENDLPLRMYGVIPLKIEDEKTKLNPLVTLPDVLEPNENFTVEVKEKNGRPMAYTVAVVDDGLLDLTRFKTPDPWNSFYAREALGVNTWDIYDQVLGNYPGDLERILSIGGDGEVNPGAAKNKANRFKPVVRHLGPFFLNQGEKMSHEIKMPNYVGSVRTMVVACDNGAYGNVEKTSPVRKPLMILATLPRVLGSGETLRLPVNVFAMEDKVKNVQVSIKEISGIVDIVGNDKQSVSFSKPGDEMVYFDLKVKEKTGVAKFLIQATGGGEQASEEIEIEVRIPNPEITEYVYGELEPGGAWKQDFDIFGVEGTNDVVLELSSIPPIDLGRRLNYLIRYPHGCFEQTVSSVFPQLYADVLLDIEENKKEQIDVNIKAGIEKLKRFQMMSGGFSSWPGGREAREWATNYGGHFILEAEAKGYELPLMMKQRWEKYQKNMARNWSFFRNDRGRYGYRNTNDLIQAYRLYTLALAGAPEWGAMNRLMEHQSLSVKAGWRLAAAYAVGGKKEVAEKIIQGLETKIESYRELGYTYGSALRDQGMILETMSYMDDKRSGELVFDIANQLSQDKWYGTHTVAYALLGISKYIGKTNAKEGFDYSYAIDGSGAIDRNCKNPISQIYISEQGGTHAISVANKSNKKLFGRLIITGKPLVGKEVAANNKLEMSVRYTNGAGENINPENIEQGTDFVVEVTVENPLRRHYEELALTQIFPSGWEIHNSRMSAMQGAENSPLDYQDVRDDRVYTYFNLGRKEKHVYRVQLNAAYPGRYYLPAVYCEAMYDNTISATTPGRWVVVVGKETM